jgi:two-component system, NtrC family, sensor kinase
VVTPPSNAIDRTLLYDQTRQAYDNLRRTQEQLLHSEKMAAVGQLISGVAHELNNPLTAILGYSQLLTASPGIGPQGIEYTDKLYKQAQRTHRIVQNLLSFARQHKPERAAVQLNQILVDTLALRDYDLRMKNIRVHLELAPDLPVTAADPHQLQQVFLNLVNNAVDAVLENASEGDLWVRTGVRGDRLSVEFTDSGPGVREPSRVFDPFYTTKPVGKGTGLGLSICYGIVTEHGGTITVSNVQPRGAKFTIELPCQAVGESREAKTRSAVLSGREGRVLLVDEDSSVLEAVGAILRGGNHNVRAASTLDGAKAALEEQEFDVVVADMRVMGNTTLAGLRAWLDGNRPALLQRLVLMRASTPTGPSGSAGEKAQACFRILQKPFKAGELLAAIEAALSDVHAAPIER